MSAQTVRQPAGTPVGGQFAATARPESDVALGHIPAPGCSCTDHETCDACIDAGVLDTPTVTGLTVPDDLDDAHRKLADALGAAGLNGTAHLSEFNSEGWARFDIDLPSGHEMSVGVARSDGAQALRREGTITAITVALCASELIDDEDTIDVQSFGGASGEIAIGEHVHKALIASAARAEFADRFPDAAANDCTVEWIGHEDAPTAFRRIEDPRKQMDGARFAVPGGDVLVTTLDGDVEIEAAGRVLSAKETYLRELAAADVTRRLGLPATGSHAETLAATVTDVIAASRNRPVVAANLRPRT